MSPCCDLEQDTFTGNTQEAVAPSQLCTGMLSKKYNRKTKTDAKHVNLKTGLNIVHLYCITNTTLIDKTTPLHVITELYKDDEQPC